MNKKILLMIIFIGILLLTIGFTLQFQKCPEQKTIYKYMPRTFEMEQNDPVYASDIFKKMFSNSDVWVATINEFDTKKHEEINKYFISRL